MVQHSTRFAFIGVSTKQSAVNAVFPSWTAIFGVECELVGIDFKVDADPAAYTEFLRQFQGPEWIGGLVTTHKARIFHYSDEIISSVTPRAKLLEEVSALYKNSNGAICGDATDSEAVMPVLRNILADERWRKGASEVLIMGGGGAGLSLLHALVLNDFGVKEITITESNPERLNYLAGKSQEITNLYRSNISVRVVNSHQTDRVVASLKPGCLIVNATGMGKDSPGSPIKDYRVVPLNSLAWDFNYRGELTFLGECRSIAHERNLRVETGWHYFICGWANVMSVVFKRKLSSSLMAEFEASAAHFLGASAAIPTAVRGKNS